MLTITWLDPRTDDADDPAWAVWDTACNGYRITWNSTRNTYVPMRRLKKLINVSCASVVDSPISNGTDTLEAAQDAVNQYHCRTHNLVLVY